MKEKFDVQGMTCSACASHIEKAVVGVDGVTSCTVNLLTNSMQVEFDKAGSEQAIIEAVVQAGYSANVQGQNQVAKSAVPKADNSLIRLIVSAVLLLVLSYIAMSHMLHLPLPSWLSGRENALTYALVQLLLLVPIVVIDRKYFVRGYKNLLRLSPNMDSLIALSATASIVYGMVAIGVMSYDFGMLSKVLDSAQREIYLAQIDSYRHQLYFESAAMILVIISLGKLLEENSKAKTKSALTTLLGLAPDSVTIIVDNMEQKVNSAQLKVGDIMVVRPGERVGGDGVVIEGDSYVDEAMLTGESAPVHKEIGEKVVSGSINKNGWLRVKIEKVGQDTTLSQIIKLVEEASSSKAPIAKVADKVAGVFVPIVMVISVVTFIVWLVAWQGGKDFAMAFNMAVSVLVISCPCALGLATPVAIMVATGKGAKCGILIKSGESLERLGQVDTIVFDKTGTLTDGKSQVLSEYYLAGVDKRKMLQTVGSIEEKSEHPLALALVEYAKENNVELVAVEDFVALSGVGVVGKVDGKEYVACSAKYAREKATNISTVESIIAEYASKAQSPVVVMSGGEILAVFGIADKVKDSAKAGIERLKAMGKKVVMLTGDNEKTAQAVAQNLGIDQVHAEVLPKDKADIVRSLQNGGKVAFVGDGINDAPALASADVGIAIGAGTDVAIESADVVLMKSQVTDVARAVRLSKIAVSNIRENLFWAFVYNTIGIPLAAGVLYPAFHIMLSPMIGSVCMSLSSVCVVLNALRINVKKLDKGEKSMKLFGKKKEERSYILIDGMMCEHCKSRVSGILSDLGIVADIDLKAKKAYFDTASASDEEIAQAIQDAGYKVLAIKRVDK